MARLTFDMGAYSYGQGLKAISLMYLAARGALDEQRRDLDSMLEKYRLYVDAGGDPIGEWDEDGHAIWDQEDNFRLDQLTIDDALSELRVATIIAVYHHWERCIPTEKGAGSRRHKDLVSGAKAAKIRVHEEIDALRICANYLKHGNQSQRAELLERWPTRFNDLTLAADPTAPWDRRLAIPDDTIEWFLDMAKASERPIAVMHDNP